MVAFLAIADLEWAEEGSQGTEGVAVEGVGRDVVAAAEGVGSLGEAVREQVAGVAEAALGPAGRFSHRQDP